MRVLNVLVLGVSAALLVGAPAGATELVDNDKAQCPTAPHTTIQAGVNAASPGEVVEVCNGSYSEQVTIAGAAKDGVRLTARVVLGATIKAPANSAGAIVKVEDADRVEVSRFRIVGPFTGPGGAGCPPGEGTSRHGVLVTGNLNASVNAQVLDNSIRQITPPVGEACPSFYGFGVEVANGSRARVGNNRIEDFGFAGVAVTNAFGHVDHNVVTGGGLGVSGFNDADLDLNSSSISGTDIGVFLEDNFNSDVSVASNRISGNRVGIEMHDQFDGHLSYNRVFSNDEQGIVAATHSVRGNVFWHNDARGNGGTDCFDASVSLGPPGYPFFTTANKWGGNKGLEASPPGICTP